jgi:hypothetical protein
LIVGLAINRTCIVIPFPTKGTKHAIPWSTITFELLWPLQWPV